MHCMTFPVHNFYILAPIPLLFTASTKDIKKCLRYFFFNKSGRNFNKLLLKRQTLLQDPSKLKSNWSTFKNCFNLALLYIKLLPISLVILVFWCYVLLALFSVLTLTQRAGPARRPAQLSGGDIGEAAVMDGPCRQPCRTVPCTLTGAVQ